MHIKEAMIGRKSIRSYKKKNIDENILKEIIEVGTLAPSACNQQRYSIILINDNSVKNTLINEAKAWQIARAPVAIYVVYDKTYNNRRLANLVGVAMSVQNMLLYAYSLGIGSIIMAGYGIEPEVRRILNIPKNQAIVCAISFGYADEIPFPPLKRKVDNILYYNSFKQNYNPKDPSNWEWSEILEFWDTTISAKSPDIGYFSYFKDEFESTINYLNKRINKKILIIFDDFALFTIELAKNNPERNFDCLISSKILNDWCIKRAKSCGIKNIKFFHKTDNIDTYDSIVLLDTLNRIPEKRFDNIFNIVKSKLKPDGIFIFSFINYLSFYGFYIRKGFGRRFGPEISLKRSVVKDLFRKHGFSLTDSVGINLVPSFKTMTRVGLPKKLEFLMPVLKIWTKVNIFERLTTKFFFKIFCNKYIYISTIIQNQEK